MTTRSARFWFGGFAAAIAFAAAAQTGTYNPDTPADPATETRLRVLSQELRCLVCQNQTIADSNADLAVDLRREVRTQILQGRTDGEIKDYLVARYGDFVLYKPPVQANTTLLWFGPPLLLIVGGMVWWVLIRRRHRAAVTPISVDDEQRAQQLLES
jgi:cytochrome c-type biogenesis protein CcmH